MRTPTPPSPPRPRAAAARPGGRGICRGFTAAELATVLAIVAILAGLGTPDFLRLRASAATASGADRLLAALHFARSRAILSGRPVVVCLSSDLENCLGRGPQAAQGWIVFENTRAEFTPERDPGEPILRTHRLSRPAALHATRAAVTYWPTPRAAATSTFEFCSEVAGSTPRAVIVSQTGRPRLRTGRPGGASACSGA